MGGGIYDQQFLASGGEDVEGQYVDTTLLPFLSPADQKANPMTANFVKYTGKENAASFGASTWAAGIAFRDALNAIVKRNGVNGVNGVTRKSLLAELATIHEFDAEGMIAPIDLAGRKVTECSVTLQVRESEIRAFRSLSASMCLAQALVIGFAFEASRREDHKARRSKV